MTITLRAVNAQAAANTPITHAKPTGTTDGDLLIMQISDPGAGDNISIVPDGWQLVGNSENSGAVEHTLYYKYANSEPASYSITNTSTVTLSIAIAAFYDSGAGVVTIADVKKQLNTGTANHTYPSVTPTTSADVLCCFSHNSLNVDASPDAAMTERWDTGGTNARNYLMTQQLASAAATGTRVSVAAGSDNSACVSLILTIAAEIKQQGPFYRSSVVATATSSTTTKTIAAPANLQVGDMMILQVEFATAGVAHTQPTGFVLVPNGAVTGANNITTYSKIAEVGDIGATLTVTFTGTQTVSLGIAAYYSPRAIPLIVEASANSDNTGASTGQTFASVTTTHQYTILHLAMVPVSSAVSSTPPTDAFLFYDTSSTPPRVVGAFSRRYASGAQGTLTFTTSSITSRTVTIAIAEDDVPGTPTSLTATAVSTSQINLGWTDVATTETGYEIEQSLTGVGSWSLIHTTAANATTYSVTGLAESTPYFYRVRAVGTYNNSGYSNTANATTDLIAPTGLSATAISSSQINLAWTDASSAEDGYYVEESPNGSTGWTVITTTAANAASYNVTTGLSQNTIYYFRVRAFHGSQNSAYASTANATTFPATATGLTATAVLSTKINLAWIDNASGETGYKVERSPNGSTGWTQIDTTSANAVSYADTTVSASTAYYYRVRPYTSSPAQNGAYSSTATATTPATLTAPSALTASVVSPTSARLSWTDTNLALSGFSLERNTNGGAFSVIASPSSSPYIDTTCTPGATHSWKIRSYRSGSFEYSSYSSTVTLIMPIAPAGVSPMYLYLLDPAVIYTARVNMATPTYPLDEIIYDGASGTYGNIRPGMTIEFGSAAGLSDQGRQRVRTVPGAGTIGIGRSPRGRHDGELNIADNSYITVYDEYRVWSKVPAFESDGTIFKDVDIAYGTNTSLPPPVSNCGPGFAGTISAGIITVQFTSTSFTTAPAATISAYLWSIGDGTLTAGSLTGASATCTFPAGFRWVHLRITDSNGKQHTSRCPVYARDPAADTSVRNFQITNHAIKQTGQTISFNIRQDVSAPPDGMLAMLWEGEAASASDRSHMVFIGWHHTDPATIAAGRTGTLKDVTLDCVDVAGMLEHLGGLSQIIEHAASPADWAHFASPTIDLYIHYLLHWHSTALDVADFQLSGTGSTYAVLIVQSSEMNMHEQIMTQCRKMIPEWVFTCNRRGQLDVNIDPFTQPTADRTATVQTTLYSFDYSGIRYTRQYFPTVSMIIKWATLAGTLTSLLSQAPGVSIGQGVEMRELTEGLAVSQAALNDATGQLYARMNSTIGKLAITLAYGDDRDIEPANMTWVDVDLPAAIAAQRGLTLTVARGLVLEMSIRYDYQKTGTVKTIDLTWEAETVGYLGATVTLETTAPIDTGGGIVIPDPPVVIPPPSVPSGVQKVAMLDNQGGIIKTSNFQSSPPTWTAFNGIVTDTGPDNFGSHNFFSMVVDPFSPLYRATGTTVRAFAVNRTAIWRIDDIFGVGGSPTITNLYTFDSGNYSALKTRSIMASFGRFFTDEADNPWLMVTSYYHDGGIHDGVWSISSQDAGTTWSAENQITPEHDPDTNIYKDYYAGLYLSPRVPGKAYAIAYHLDSADPYSTSPRNYVSSDWGATWSFATGALDLTPGNNLGGALHVPYAGNTSESIVWYGNLGVYDFHLLLADGAGYDRTPPAISTILYGPLRYAFGVRTFDDDRRYVAMAGRGNGIDDLYLVSTNNKAAVFVSDDYGVTWTNIVTPISANVNDVYPDSVAFSADDRNVIYMWGNEFYVAQSTDFGATVENKYGNIGGLAYSGYEEVLLFVGGDA